MENKTAEKQITPQQEKEMDRRLEALALIGAFGKKHSQKKEYFKRRRQ